MLIYYTNAAWNYQQLISKSLPRDVQVSFELPSPRLSGLISKVSVSFNVVRNFYVFPVWHSTRNWRPTSSENIILDDGKASAQAVVLDETARDAVNEHWFPFYPLAVGNANHSHWLIPVLISFTNIAKWLRRQWAEGRIQTKRIEPAFHLFNSPSRAKDLILSDAFFKFRNVRLWLKNQGDITLLLPCGWI
jgi:hypothetical protein